MFQQIFVQVLIIAAYNIPSKDRWMTIVADPFFKKGVSDSYYVIEIDASSLLKNCSGFTFDNIFNLSND